MLAAVKVDEMDHYLAAVMVLLQADYLADLSETMQADRKDSEMVD